MVDELSTLDKVRRSVQGSRVPCPNQGSDIEGQLHDAMKRIGQLEIVLRRVLGTVETHDKLFKSEKWHKRLYDGFPKTERTL